MHAFPKETRMDLPERFTDPFRYSPHHLTLTAAETLMAELDSWSRMPEDCEEKIFEKHLSEGKMLGVLVVADAHAESVISADSPETLPAGAYSQVSSLQSSI